MSNLRARVNAFFYKNRSKGVPNLMLYLAIGNVVVYILSMFNPNNLLFYDLLRFDYEKILGLQLWRLFSYPLTYLTATALSSGMGVLLGAISLFFYYICGKMIEGSWGVLRFNCYYLAGVLLTDAAAMLIGLIGGVSYPATAYYINLSLFLAVATLQPEAGVRLYFFIPVKMKWLAWFELGLTAFEIVKLLLGYGFLRLVWILPVFALLNYFLFFGAGCRNILPGASGVNRTRAQVHTAQRFRAATQQQGPIHAARPYRFKCTVCGRTDVSNPNLEFRYCSKCAGYRCYCMDHINNHTHISV